MSRTGNKSRLYLDLLGSQDSEYFQTFIHTAKAYFPNLTLQEKQKCKKLKNKSSATGIFEIRTQDAGIGTSDGLIDTPNQTDDISTTSQSTSTCEQTESHCQTIHIDTIAECCQTVSPGITDQCMQTLSPVSVAQMCDVVLTTWKSIQTDGEESKAVQTDHPRPKRQDYGHDAASVVIINDVPSHWVKLQDKDSQEVLVLDVKEHTDEFKEIRESFMASMNARNFRIKSFKLQRIQNRHLWAEFCWRKHQLEKQRMTRQHTSKKCRKLEEKLLFHGTSERTIPLITKQGFDMRMNGKNMTKFGRGTYFARDSRYSHDYTETSFKGFCRIRDGFTIREAKMFVARVLVGDYNVGKEDIVRPDWDDELGKFNELCVNSDVSPSIFVIFNNDQTYPEYLITYQY